MEFQLEQEYKFCEYLIKNANQYPLTMEQLLYGIATDIGIVGSAGLNDIIRKFLREEYLNNVYSGKDETTNIFKEEDRLYSLSNKGKTYFNYLQERKELERFTIELNQSTIKTNRSIKWSTIVIAFATVVNVVIAIASYFKENTCVLQLQSQQSKSKTIK